MTRYRLETENRKWLNTFNTLNSAVDFAKSELTSQLIFDGVPKEYWSTLAKRCILTDLSTQEEFIVFYDGSKMLLSKYKSL